YGACARRRSRTRTASRSMAHSRPSTVFCTEVPRALFTSPIGRGRPSSRSEDGRVRGYKLTESGPPSPQPSPQRGEGARCARGPGTDPKQPGALSNHDRTDARAAADIERLAGDEAVVRIGKEHHRAGDVVAAAEALDRDRCGQRPLARIA